MIAQRMDNGPDQAPLSEARLSAAIKRFAAPMPESQGAWCMFESEAQLVRAVIREISETVLARRISISVKETGASLTLTVANRRLVNVEGLTRDNAGDMAPAVASALTRWAAGGRSMKIEVKDRNPDIPTTSWSCSVRTLASIFDTAGSGKSSDVAFQTLSGTIRSLADDILDPGLAPNGQMKPESLVILRAIAEKWASQSKASAHVRMRGPKLAMLAASGNRFIAVLESRNGPLFALCSADKRSEMVEAWRDYCQS